MITKKNMMGSKLFLIYFLILFTVNFAVICDTKDIPVTDRCRVESCGQIHNISYPFWIEDQPEECREPNYKLVCASNKLEIRIKGINFNVLSINRANLTIRLVESLFHRKNCSSVPRSTLDFGTAYHPQFDKFIADQSFTYVHDQNQRIIFLSCEKPLANSSLFIDTEPCINGSAVVEKKCQHNYSYVTYDIAEISDLGETCSVDLATMTAKPITCGLNCSYSEIHDMIAYGFEVSWEYISCKKYCKGQELCRVEAGGEEISDCRAHCDIKCWIIKIGESIGFGIYMLTLYGIIPLLFLRFIIGLPIYIGLLIHKWRTRHKSMYDSVEEFLVSQNNLRPVNYSFSAIKNITKDFKEKLGEGGYGSVYKGRIRSGRDVAVKVLGKSKSNGQEFINEVATIGTIHHVNVVRLIGFCAEGSKRALVYEFMPNGSLEKYLYSNEGNASFSVEKMLEISLGVARGIEYLHKGCDMRILHFDIKPHNILLDDNFTPKVSDFGLARLYPTDSQSIVSMTAARGTIGYIAPELFYRNIGSVSHKADVYSFGMLLLEMTGKRRMPKESSQVYFHSWVYDQVCSGNSVGIDDISADETRVVRKMVIVGLWCIQTRPDDRPSMNKVIEMLNTETESLEMPAKPCLYVEEETDLTFSSVLSEDSKDSSSLIINVN